MFTLHGKTALITGAASGIGAAIADAFGAAGAKVIVTDVSQSGATQQSESLRSRGVDSRAFVMDVTRPESIAGVVSELESSGLAVDILVNNAGIGHVGTLLKTTSEDLQRLWNVNVRGVFEVTRALLPGMLARRSGTIINLASIAGIVGIRDRLAYTTTKFAVVGFTKALALDHAKDGIRCNCICPGRVETPFVTAMIAQYPDPAKARAEMEATQAIGRMARPDEIAGAALYLASDIAGSVTGSALIIDGGWSAGK
ncbi:MAG: glucose 1-dehydrogenase [Verrucomicrobiales bacterium]|nr:glucose 1-dehydrogenase [Verrucomicrobiales bacterium]